LRERAFSAAFVWLVATGALGCNDEVSLGEFGCEQGGGGTQDPLPECGATGDEVLVNQPGVGVGVTITYTDWIWTGPFDSLEWELRIEVAPPNDGYLWAHEFSLANGNTGLITMQANGGYQAEPPAGPTVIANIVQFWISGPPIRAELGDIPAPDARTSIETQVGLEWWTINARYEFETCRTYRFSVAREETEPTGGRWYAGRILDTETGAETLIGRILVQEVWGRFAAPIRSWTNRIGWTPATTCDVPEPAAAIFGVPTANGGSVVPTLRNNRFAMPPLCPSSRITNFPNAVRQEIGQLP
jgi:hypothetical protein